MDTPNPGCVEVQADLEALHYGDLDPEERAALQRHLAGCPGCSAALALVRETALALDRLELPRPDDDDWARLRAGIQERIAPLGSLREFRRRARLGSAARIAAVVLVGGLATLSAVLYFRIREQESRIAALTREVADLALEEGDLPRAKRAYHELAIGDELDSREKCVYRALTAQDDRPVRAYLHARRQSGDKVRDELGEILWRFPTHWLAEQAFVALQKRGDATPPPFWAIALKAPRVVLPPLPQAQPARHFEGEVDRLKEIAAASEPRVRAWALLRAARIAEEDLKDRSRAILEYRNVLASVAPGPIRDAAAERLRVLEGTR